MIEKILIGKIKLLYGTRHGARNLFLGGGKGQVNFLKGQA